MGNFAKVKPTPREAHKRAYNSWKNMRDRCLYRTSLNYVTCGAKGIRICKRWHDFKSFLEDMGDPPEGHILARVDESKDYEPSNVRWMTHKEHALYKHNTTTVSFEGKKVSLKDYCKIKGLCYDTVLIRKAKGASNKEMFLSVEDYRNLRKKPHQKI